MPICALRMGNLSPGATSSGFLSGSCLGKCSGNRNPLSPMDELLHTEPSVSMAPTQMTSKTLPGLATSPSSSGPPSFPAAATTNMPSSMARSTAASSASVSMKIQSMPCAPPKLSEMMSTPFSTHQSTASAMSVSDPVPDLEMALAMYRSTLGAIPGRRFLATKIPAIPVP